MPASFHTGMSGWSPLRVTSSLTLPERWAKAPKSHGEDGMAPATKRARCSKQPTGKQADSNATRASSMSFTPTGIGIRHGPFLQAENKRLLTANPSMQGSLKRQLASASRGVPNAIPCYRPNNKKALACWPATGGPYYGISYKSTGLLVRWLRMRVRAAHTTS